jgi:hypothetical protein
VTIGWAKANPTRPWNGSFQFRRVKLANLPGGRTLALRPLLTADLVYRGKRFPTFALIDSGADWSLLPWEVAEDLGIDIDSLPGPERGVAGSTGSGTGRVAEVDLEFQVNPLPGKMTLPFLAMRPPPAGTERSPASKSVLVGRHPFFEWVDIHFRMGFTSDPNLGKWTMREVTKKRPSENVRRAGPLPTFGSSTRSGGR